MTTTSLEPRVDRLEDLVAELTRNVNRLSVEMREFKDEMRESRVRSEREMKEFREELARISDSQGRLAEDIVAPSIPGVLAQVVGCLEELHLEGIRIRKHLPGQGNQEYDVVAICGDYLLVNETKSHLRPEHVPKFLHKLQQTRTFFPEYADKQIIGALATFYAGPSLVTYVTRQGVILLGIVDGLMQVVNPADFTPRAF